MKEAVADNITSPEVANSHELLATAKNVVRGPAVFPKEKTNSYHDSLKAKNFVIVLQHFDEVFLRRLWHEGCEAGLQRVLQRSKVVVWWDFL
jgi:hypothetical protein